jgi:hypothetical protein
MDSLTLLVYADRSATLARELYAAGAIVAETNAANPAQVQVIAYASDIETLNRIRPIVRRWSDADDAVK